MRSGERTQSTGMPIENRLKFSRNESLAWARTETGSMPSVALSGARPGRENHEITLRN